MLWLTILIGIFFAAVAVGYVVWPIFSSKQQMVAVEDDAITQLIYRKDTVLLSIKELEFDYHMGKLSEADFTRFNHRLRQQAMGLLRQIEKIAPDTTSIEGELEKMITHYRQHRQIQSTKSVSIDALDELPAAHFCHQCGVKASSTHNFCAKCGVDLRIEQQKVS